MGGPAGGHGGLRPGPGTETRPWLWNKAEAQAGQLEGLAADSLGWVRLSAPLTGPSWGDRWWRGLSHREWRIVQKALIGGSSWGLLPRPAWPSTVKHFPGGVPHGALSTPPFIALSPSAPPSGFLARLPPRRELGREQLEKALLGCQRAASLLLS